VGVQFVEQCVCHFIPSAKWEKGYTIPGYGYFPLSPLKLVSRTIIVATTTLIVSPPSPNHPPWNRMSIIAVSRMTTRPDGGLCCVIVCLLQDMGQNCLLLETLSWVWCSRGFAGLQAIILPFFNGRATQESSSMALLYSFALWPCLNCVRWNAGEMLVMLCNAREGISDFNHWCLLQIWSDSLERSASGPW